MLKTKFLIDPEVYWLVCICVLLLPFDFCFAWFVSVMVHELSHYIALRLTGSNVLSVNIGLIGAKIKTQQLVNSSELICAAAGPLGGFLLIVFLEKFPLLSVVSFLLSVFNLLPLYPLDGGRIAHCLIYKIFTNPARVIIIFDIAVTVILLLLSIVLSFYLSTGALPIIIVISLVARYRKKIFLQT